jgi:hypothetical protein
MTVKAPKLLDKKYADWLALFEKVATINGWNDSEKLTHAILALTRSAQTWALHSSHENWESFVKEFKARYMKKKSSLQFITKLMTFKQKSGESNRKYIRRLEKLWNLQNAAANEHREEHGGTAIEPVIIKSLVKGIKSKSLRRALRTQDYTCVSLFIQGFKDLDDIDDDSDSDLDTDTDSHSAYSTDSDNSYHSGKTTSTVKKVRSTSVMAPSNEKEEISSLTESVKQMTVALMEKQDKMYDAMMASLKAQNASGLNKNKNYCYNCEANGHRSVNCPQPCRYCKGEHPNFECSLHPPNIAKAKKKEEMDAKLCQLIPEERQDAFAVTRKANDMEQDSLPDKGKKKVKIQHRPSPQPIARNQIVASDVLNAQVFPVSIAQMAEWNAALRTSFKDGLTRKHKPKGAAQAFHVTEPDQSPLPSGLSAPHTMGTIAGFECPMILDGGCTPNIISKNLALYLGFTELEVAKTRLAIANGDSVLPLGILKGVTITVGPSRKIEVDAVCLDIPDYDFLVGRQSFHRLGIDTNWRKHVWRVLDDQGKSTEMDVSYSHARMTGDFPLKEGMELIENDDASYVASETSAYLVAFAGMAESTNEEDVGNGSRLGNLVSRIKANGTISNLGITDDVVNCVEKYADCFGTGYEHLRQTHVTELHVETGDALPIYRRPYGNLSHNEKEFLRQEIADMVNNGIVVPSTYVPQTSKHAGWSFPCRLIEKKTGGKRLVTNFMDLNKVTIRDTWPLPIMTELLEQLGGSKFFSSMDLLKGFHQIRVNDQSMNKLTISTPFGNYSYVVMPFGIQNGPSTFCRAIYLALQDMLDSSVVAYIDDIVVHSSLKRLSPLWVLLQMNLGTILIQLGYKPLPPSLVLPAKGISVRFWESLGFIAVISICLLITLCLLLNV